MELVDTEVSAWRGVWVFRWAPRCKLTFIIHGVTAELKSEVYWEYRRGHSWLGKKKWDRDIYTVSNYVVLLPF